MTPCHVTHLILKEICTICLYFNVEILNIAEIMILFLKDNLFIDLSPCAKTLTNQIWCHLYLHIMDSGLIPFNKNTSYVPLTHQLGKQTAPL